MPSAYEFYSLGFDAVFPVLPFRERHRRALDELIKISEEVIDDGQSDIINIAVGKAQRRQIQPRKQAGGYERTIVSDIPGTTRDAVDTLLEYEGKNTT